MMYFLLLVTALAVAGIGWQVRQSLFPADAKPPNRAYAVVGFFLATQTQREIAGQRGSVVLVLPPASALAAETAETYANAFRAPLLRGHPEWEVQIATLEAPARDVKTGTFPLAAFKQVVAKFPGALAAVFSCPAGFPRGRVGLQIKELLTT